MSDFIERIKKDRIAQLIIVGFILGFIILLYILRGFLFSGNEDQDVPCYQVTLKIWSPFNEDEFLNLFRELEQYCLYFEIEKKSLEEIDRDLLFSLAEKPPDIVYVDNELFRKYEKFFATPTPVSVDALVAYYNQDVLNFLNLEKPRTLDDLLDFIQKIRGYRRDFYPVGLGTKWIKNRKEIILSLYSFNENYKNKQNFRNNFKRTIDEYFKFSDPQSEFFAYREDIGEDLINFAQERLALYIGFYQDKEEILKINPHLNFSISYSPLNTFPPKAKVYTKIYYLAPLKTPNLNMANLFLDYFDKYKLLDFSNQFDLVPYRELQNLPPEKKIVLDSVKNFGETFDFLNKKILFDNLDTLLDFSKDEYQFQRVFERIYYSI
jgi:hypothetical protein